MAKTVVRENRIWRRTTELEELFFYTLYMFRAYWVAGKVNDRTARRIKTLTGVSVAGFEVHLESGYLKHFLYSHFHEKSGRQRDITFDDVNQLLRMVNSFTYVELGNEPNTLLFVTNFPNGTFELAVGINDTKKYLFGKSLRIKT